MMKSIVAAVLLALTPSATNVTTVDNKALTTPAPAQSVDQRKRRKEFVDSLDEFVVRVEDKTKKKARITSVLFGSAGGSFEPGQLVIVVMTVGDRQEGLLFGFNEQVGGYRPMNEQFAPEAQLNPDGTEKN